MYFDKKLLTARNFTERYSKKIFLMNLYQLVNISTSLIVSIAFARLASQELYGQYIFIISVVSFLSLVSIPGTRTTIFRAVSQGKDGFYVDIVKFNFLWSLLGVPILITLGIYFYFRTSNYIGLAVISSSLFFPFIYSLENWKSLLKGKEKFGKFLVYESSIAICKALCIISILLFDISNLNLLIIIYFGISSLFNIIFFFKSLNYLSYSNSQITWKKESYAYTLLDFTSYSFTKIDRVLLGFFVSFDSLAIYSIAMKTVDSLSKFIKSSIEAVLPDFFNGKYNFSQFYIIFWALFIIPIALYPIIEHVIVMLFSKTYIDSALYARIYLFVLPFYFLSYVSTQALIKYKCTREVNLAKLTSLAIFICLMLILIPKLGILGGVLASFIFYPIQAILMMYYLWRKNIIYIKDSPIKSSNT